MAIVFHAEVGGVTLPRPIDIPKRHFLHDLTTMAVKMLSLAMLALAVSKSKRNMLL
jgi:hypothetical protein